MGGTASSSTQVYPKEEQRHHHAAKRNAVQQGDGKESLFQLILNSCVQSRSVNQPLYKRMLQHPLAAHWSPMPANKEYMLVTLSQKSSEYKEIKNLFKSTTKRHYSVIEINRVQNPFLLGCYLLKKQEMEVTYGRVHEQLVFHGTKESNVTKICEDNFNWRMHGESAGSTYGQGVSFSPISYYSSHYSSQDQEVKTMFVVRILIHESIVGSSNMILPPNRGRGNKRYDTAAKENGHVLVKFCDNEFYPQYLVYYKGSPDSKSKSLSDMNAFCIILLMVLAYWWYSNVHIENAQE